MTAQVLIAVVVGLAAAADDIARRRISNWIPLTALAAGFALQIAAAGWRGALAALSGAAAGFGVFLIFYLLGGMGGGDIKLMAGFGAILGVGRLLEAALWTAGCGGLMAAGVIAMGILRGYRKREHSVTATARPGAAPVSIPYAPAIAAGVWLSLIPKT
jgi:prepilin peptidase CpaA